MKRMLRPALSALLLAASALPAFAGSDIPPTLEQYPLRDRFFGPGGAVFPNYSMPSEGGLSYMIAAGPTLAGPTKAGGPGVAIFAAGTADFNCQTGQRPTIKVISAPAGAKVSVSPGTFVATGIDGGATTKCLGQPVGGSIVRYAGRPPRGGGAVTLRVTYPYLGAWYDHVVHVPGN